MKSGYFYFLILTSLLLNACAPRILRIGSTLKSSNAIVQFKQQGAKLVGTGNVGAAFQAQNVALSSDGFTALIGGGNDNGGQGATWVFTRSGSTWTQQGSKLVGTGNVGAAKQGYITAISSDGNTALIGGYNDNGGVGAIWIFTRSGSTWTQQGAKLVGTGTVGSAHFGVSVALSSDGNTALIGGQADNGWHGAVWIFTRAGGVWTQQGAKLLGTGNVGNPCHGSSVALSSDGNTALIGSFGDNGNQGATWVFTRAGGVWTQQGSKLVGTGNVGVASQGSSVAVSADGNTAFIGGPDDNSGIGSVWVFTRSGTTWTQQGSKLLDSDHVGSGGASFGYYVAVSADANTAVFGGWADNSLQGAAWVFTHSGSTWTQLGTKLVGSDNVGAANLGSGVALSADGLTALAGGSADNGNQGAVWVFTP